MATTAMIGSQTLLKRGDGNSPEAFAIVYEITNMTDIGEEADLIEATHMLSTAKEYVYGLPDGKEFTATVSYKYNDSTHAGLINDARIRVARNFQLFLPSLSVKFYFTALVRIWNVGPWSPNEIISATFGFKITGSVIGPS